MNNRYLYRIFSIHYLKTFSQNNVFIYISWCIYLIIRMFKLQGWRVKRSRSPGCVSPSSVVVTNSECLFPSRTQWSTTAWQTAPGTKRSRWSTWNSLPPRVSGRTSPPVCREWNLSQDVPPHLCLHRPVATSASVAAEIFWFLFFMNTNFCWFSW